MGSTESTAAGDNTTNAALQAITTLQECSFERSCNGAPQQQLHSLILQLKLHAPPKVLLVELLNDKEPVYRFNIPANSFDSELGYYTTVQDFDDKVPTSAFYTVEQQSSDDLEIYNSALLERDSIFELTWTFKPMPNESSAVQIRCNHNRIERAIYCSSKQLLQVNRVRVIYDHIRCDLVNIDLITRVPLSTGASPIPNSQNSVTSVRKSKNHEYTTRSLYTKEREAIKNTLAVVDSQSSTVSPICTSRRYKLIDSNACNITATSTLYPTREERLSLAVCIINNLSKCSGFDHCSHEAMLMGYTLEEWNQRFIILSNDDIVVVVFRATSSAEDFVDDVEINQLTVPFENVPVNSGTISIHQGFYKRGANDLPCAFPQWTKHLSKDKELFVMGHSLGGSSAMVFTLVNVIGMPECSELFKSLNCITIGAPMVGNRACAETVNAHYKQNFEHWLRDSDPVPLFPQCPTFITRILSSLASKALISASSIDPITTEYEDEYNASFIMNRYHSAGTIYTFSGTKTCPIIATSSSSPVVQIMNHHGDEQCTCNVLVKQVEAVEHAYSTWSYVKYHETGCFVRDFAANHLLYKYIEDLTVLAAKHIVL